MGRRAVESLLGLIDGDGGTLDAGPEGTSQVVPALVRRAGTAPAPD
ncbi:hypothetical protein [Nonomuraea sp. MG754425]|nr:hypothetical protein [Nonomuraea sp. MG754425]